MTVARLDISTTPPAKNPSSTPPVRGLFWRRLRWIVIALVLGLGAWYASVNVGGWKDLVVPRKLRTIDPGRIYASGQINKRLIRGVLEGDQIKVVACLLGDDASDPDVAAELRACADLGIKRYNFPLSGDGTGDIHQYAEAVTLMVQCEKQGTPLLVHCSSGLQRSGGAQFYYRVLVQHRAVDESLAEMKSNGRLDPALVPYLDAHMQEMASLLVQRGVIDRQPDQLPHLHP